MAKRKIGLALGSGGAKGLAHIGVLKVFAKEHVPIDYLAGSSIGAVIGALYAAGRDPEYLEHILLESTWKTNLRFIDFSLRGGFVKGKKIQSLLHHLIRNVDFSNLRLPFTAVATDFATGEEVHISQGDLLAALRSSYAVAPVFKPICFEGRLLVDGGLSNPVPVNVVRDMGAHMAIAVNLEGGNFVGDTEVMRTSIRSVSIRSVNIMAHNLAIKSVAQADILIEPKVDTFGLVQLKEFLDKDRMKRYIRLGEKAAKKALPEILHFLRG